MDIGGRKCDKQSLFVHAKHTGKNLEEPGSYDLSSISSIMQKAASAYIRVHLEAWSSTRTLTSTTITPLKLALTLCIRLLPLLSHLFCGTVLRWISNGSSTRRCTIFHWPLGHFGILAEIRLYLDYRGYIPAVRRQYRRCASICRLDFMHTQSSQTHTIRTSWPTQRALAAAKFQPLWLRALAFLRKCGTHDLNDCT